MTQIKLQKALQAAGFDNRRSIRKDISEGKYKVNNQVIKDPNHLVDIAKDTIRFLEKKIKMTLDKKLYFILNKPYGVISSLMDPEGRPTVKDLIPKIKERVYPVGRLDYNSEGMVLLTNDGDLTNFIISAKNQVPKLYKVKIKGILEDAERIKLLTKGIVIDGKRIKPLKIQNLRKTGKGNSWIMVTIVEGKKHLVRNIFKYSGHPVEKLVRIGIGTFRLQKLPLGHSRLITPEELDTFKERYGYPG